METSTGKKKHTNSGYNGATSETEQKRKTAKPSVVFPFANVKYGSLYLCAINHVV